MEDSNELGYCALCANRCPEMCERCVYVEAPDGSLSQATNYVYFDGKIDIKKIKNIKGKKEQYAKLIESYVKKGGAVPLRLVIEYNKCIGNIREENQK